MRVIFIPNSSTDWFGFLIGALVLFGVVVGIFLWQRIFPSPLKKLLADPRYHHALGVYVDKLGDGEPTREQRWDAFDGARDYLVGVLGVPDGEAEANLRLMVAAHDKDRSYELRAEATDLEEAGEYESALALFERAAELQFENDPKDYEFLKRCIARVRRKIR